MNDILKMDFQEFINYCVGRLVIAIGKGNFRNEVAQVIIMASQRATQIDKQY